MNGTSLSEAESAYVLAHMETTPASHIARHLTRDPKTIRRHIKRIRKAQGIPMPQKPVSVRRGPKPRVPRITEADYPIVTDTSLSLEERGRRIGVGIGAVKAALKRLRDAGWDLPKGTGNGVIWRDWELQILWDNRHLSHREVNATLLPHRKPGAIGTKRSEIGATCTKDFAAEARKKSGEASKRAAERNRRPADVIDDTPDGAVFTTASGVPAIRVGRISLPYIPSLYSDHVTAPSAQGRVSSPQAVA